MILIIKSIWNIFYTNNSLSLAPNRLDPMVSPKGFVMKLKLYENAWIYRSGQQTWLKSFQATREVSVPNGCVTPGR